MGEVTPGEAVVLDLEVSLGQSVLVVHVRCALQGGGRDDVGCPQTCVILRRGIQSVWWPIGLGAYSSRKSD